MLLVLKAGLVAATRLPPGLSGLDALNAKLTQAMTMTTAPGGDDDGSGGGAAEAETKREAGVEESPIGRTQSGPAGIRII